MKVRALAALWFLAAVALVADPRDFGVPAPRGWIGTTSEWLQGIGIVFALLDLVLLAAIWWMIRTRGVTSISKVFLFGAVLILPVIVVFLATAHGMEASSTVEACGSCHIMESHVADLRDPKGDSLAAAHYKNRYIQQNHCYTCHSDYGMAGTVGAKLAGLGHTWRNLTGSYELPLKIRRPYSNLRCLSCHGGAQNFLGKHDKDEIPKLMADKDSCLDCHGPAHAPDTKNAPAAARQAIE